MITNFDSTWPEDVVRNEKRFHRQAAEEIQFWSILKSRIKPVA